MFPKPVWRDADRLVGSRFAGTWLTPFVFRFPSLSCRPCRSVEKKSSLPLIMTMTLAFIGLVVIQSIFFKPKIPDAANEQKTVQKQEDNELAAVEPKQGTEQEEPQDPAAGSPENAADVEPQQQFPRKFLRLGEFNPEAPALVVLLDSRGATLRRVELNDRKPNGRIRFRDVDYRQAYIGQLELEQTDAGCVARVVTPGTPAHQAGMLEGDILKTINGEPVVSPDDADAMLTRIKPGQQIAVQVVRNSDTLQLQVESTRMPMQVVRPTPKDQLTDMNMKRRGFQWTLKQQQMGEWPDIDEQMRFANWESELLEIDGQQVAQFKYKLPVTEDGRRFEVIKRFRLPNTDEREFHIVLDLEIRNLGDAPATVNYELCGPVGAPKEGWWYQQKIHGNTWAFFRTAGARDLVMSTAANPFWFISGPQIVTDKENDFAGTPLIEKGAPMEKRNLRFLGVDAQYFNVALLPENEDYSCFSSFGLTASALDDNKSRRRRTTDVSFVIFSNPLELQPWDETSPDTAYRESFRIFAGPKEPGVLQTYGLQDTRTFGWFAMFSKPLVWLLHWLYKLTFSWSYGLAIIMLTVIVRMCMVPISRKAALNAQMMQHLSPDIKELAEKYKDNPEKRIQAQRELFAKYNYNPLGGCLLMFLQLPIFLGLYRGLSVDIALRDAPLIPGLSWCSNLAGPDKLFYWADWMPAFLASETGFLGPFFNLLPVIAIGFMLVQQKMFMPPATDDQSRMAQKMMKFMMLFFGFIFFKVASGLCIYFIASSIWGIIERKALPKPELDKSKLENMDSGKKSVFRGRSAVDEAVSLPLRSSEQLEERRRRDKARKRKLRDRK